MTQIGANFGQLGNTVDHIARTASAVNGQLSDLKTYLAPMVATWEGDAATQYNQLQKDWDLAADDLNVVLHKIGLALGDTNADFQATERSNLLRF